MNMRTKFILTGLTLFVLVCFELLPANGEITSPSSLPGCVLWLDGADEDTITVENNGVSAWADKSGNGNSVTQLVSSNRPAYVSESLNGLSVLNFDGDSWMTGTAVLDQGDDTFSYFAVWKRAATGGAQSVFEQAQSSTSAGSRAALLTVDTSYGFNGQYNDAHSLAPFEGNEWKISGMEIDGRSTRNVILYDTTNYFTGAINMTVQNIGTNGISVGAKYFDKTEKLIGDIAEIIVYERILDDTERNAVLYYLQQKWGVECGVQDLAMLIDFEHDLWPNGWVTNGAAFVTQPICSSRCDFNKRGDWMISTYDADKNNGTTTQGNGVTGSAIGPAFVLSNNVIRARVGGGYYVGSGQECMLRLERRMESGAWEVVRKVTGPSSNALREFRWNVNSLIGETVRFSLVDNYTGSWGQISADDIRVLDEPMPRSLWTDFDETDLPRELIPYKPFRSETVELTGTGTVRLALLATGTGTHDIWSTVDKGCKLLLNTVDDDKFTLETHLLSYNNNSANIMTGLTLVFGDPSENTFDSVMFGSHRDGLVLQGPSIGSTTIANGIFKNIWLRITGYMDSFSFFYSLDGQIWHSAGTKNLEGKELLHAGLFAKDWSNYDTDLTAEYDYLGYQAKEIPLGTVIMLN